MEPYSGLRRKYYCGHDYQKPEPVRHEPYLYVIIDANEATIAATNGEGVRVLWSEQSHVMHKHDMGGQSKARFQRGREEALKAWLRKVAEVVTAEVGDRQLVVGGPGMTKDKFIEELPQNVSNKISRVESCGYTDENGVYELQKRSRYVSVMSP